MQQTLHYWIRPHERVPVAPIPSTAAWRGESLVQRSDWLESLDAVAIAELEAAASHSRGRPLRDLTRHDFPLPTLRTAVARWRLALDRGLGVQVLRGLPVDRWDTHTCERVFWGLGLHLGVPGAQNDAGDLLGHVRSEGLSYDDPAVRGYQTSAKLSYHCDAADVVGLMCLRAAKSGGRSRFVSSVTVFNRLVAERPDLARRLFAPMQLDTRGDGGVDFVPIAPCRYADGQLRTFYHADYFRSAERQPGARQLDASERELLERYDAIASEPGTFLEMELRPGDVQLLSNHTILHSRTAYEDHPEPERRRHLLRLWLSLPKGRAVLHPSEVAEGARLLSELVRGRVRKRLNA